MGTRLRVICTGPASGRECESAGACSKRRRRATPGHACPCIGGDMSSSRSRQRRRLGIGLTAAAALLIAGVAAALPVLADDGGDNTQPVDFTHNAFDAPAPVAGSVFGSGPGVKAGQQLCTTATSTAANVNTDCQEA